MNTRSQLTPHSARATAPPMRAALALIAAACLTLTACREEGTLNSTDTARAQLNIIASSRAPGDRIEVDVSYRRTQGADVLFASQTFPVETSGNQSLSMPIKLVACLLDPLHLKPTDGECSLVVRLTLRNAVNAKVDSSMIGPFPLSPGQSGGGESVLVSVNSVSVTATSTTLGIGDTTTAVAVARDGAGKAIVGRPVQWTTTNGSVVSISQTGKITALAAGTANVNASVQGVIGTAPITVTNLQVATVSVTLAPAAFVVGATSQATATARSATGTVINGRTVAYASSNQSVATISATGVITALALGNTNITATVDGIQGTVIATVLTPPLAYAVADQPAATTYTASGFVSTGGTITINRNNVGTYFVIFNSFGLPASTSNIGVHVAAGSGVANTGLTALASTCYVVAVAASTPLTFHVQCEAYAGGAAIDSPFRLTVLGAPDVRLPMPSGSAFSFTNDTTTPTPFASSSPFTWSQTPGPVTISRSVTFATSKGTVHSYPPASPVLPMGRYVTPLMNGQGRAPVCTSPGVEGDVFSPVAACYAGFQSGAVERRQHWVVQLSGAYPGHEGASISVNAATGQVNTSSSWTTGTGTTIAHPAPGKYFITFEGVNAGNNAFTVMLTAIGSTGMTGCSYFVRGSNPIALDIACATQTNVPTNPPSGFNVFVMR